MGIIDDRSSWANPLFVRSSGGGRRAWREMLGMFERGEIIVPEYQRARVWTAAQKAEWVGHVLSQAPVPAIFVRQVDTSSGFRDELLDGQQRITALMDWIYGRVPARIQWSGKEVWCRSNADAVMVYRLTTPVMELPTDTTAAEAITAYLSLNSCGVVHAESDLEHARKMLAKALGA